MSRFTITLGSVVVLACGQVAAADESVSYFLEETPTPVRVAIVPAGGFVLTGFILSRLGSSPSYIRFYQGDPNNDGQIKMELNSNQFTTPTSGWWSEQARIPFDSGSELWFWTSNNCDVTLTVVGYIPTPTSSIPAVSSVGLLIMAVMVLGAGAMVLSRRKQPVV